jgi:hypothetical protein
MALWFQRQLSGPNFGRSLLRFCGISSCFLAASCSPIAPILYAGIAICQMRKENPPRTELTDKVISISVRNATFYVEEMGVKTMKIPQYCLVSLVVKSSGVPERLDVPLHNSSTPRGKETLYRGIDALYLEAAKKFANSDIFGCTVGRIVVSESRYKDGKYHHRKGYIDKVIIPDASSPESTTHHC